MTSSFPTSIKSFTTKVDNVTQVLAAHINDLQDETVALENFNGVNGAKLIRDNGLLNGTVLPAVFSNDLYVYLMQNDNATSGQPTSPIYVKINNTIRQVTGSLYNICLDGTNWFNSGGAELATKEHDLFVYLAWSAADSAVCIGLSRIPYAKTFSDFSGTATSDRYARFAKGANLAHSLAAADDVIVVGRIAATLSAGAGYTWTIPTKTTKNVIQYPIYETRVLTWQPAYTNLTVGNGTTTAYYQVIGSRCKAQNSFVLGSTSSVSGLISHTLPINRTTTYYAGAGGSGVIGTCKISDTGTINYVGLPTSSALGTTTIYANGASATYSTQVATSGTVPMTWTTGDILDTWLEYQLAEGL